MFIRTEDAYINCIPSSLLDRFRSIFSESEKNAQEEYINWIKPASEWNYIAPRPVVRMSRSAAFGLQIIG